MIQTIALLPGVTLRVFPAERFKQGCLSLQFLRPMCKEEAALNAIIPAVLLRGTTAHPDLRSITLRLDDLYGASVGALVRRAGDYQTVGLYSSFIEDRYAMPGDRVLEPMLDFLEELMLDPIREGEGFSREFVESEKRNLIATIESERNDKRAYTAAQMLKRMCAGDSYGVPRLGECAQVEQIDADNAWAHYQKVLRHSPVEVFYVGNGDPEIVAQKLRRLFGRIDRAPEALPEQTPFRDGGCGGDYTEAMEISQGKLSMGFVTPIFNKSKEFAAMQVLNTVFGAGMTSKLFMNVREKMSLCYSIGSGYYGTKGIMTVSAGIDCDKEPVVRAEILHQMEACCAGQITAEELAAGKEAILSGLRGVHDSPGSIEGYETVAAISGLPLTVEQYYRAVEAVTVDAVAAAARTVRLHTTYFLKGVDA
ncbi:MAG: insulinase family protein [Oscillospiraceae bacterium]|nr:insulinase family protein [Oscillospiraceae bacterium]